MEAELRNGKNHVRFCIEVYRLQFQGRRHFVHEHLEKSKAWDMNGINIGGSWTTRTRRLQRCGGRIAALDAYRDRPCGYYCDSDSDVCDERGDPLDSEEPEEEE